MLGMWRTHADYLQSLETALAGLSSDQCQRLSLYQKELSKLRLMNLDSLKSLLASRYSTTGRPALHQPEIFRSLFLMLATKETSITNWVNILAHDTLFTAFVGLGPEEKLPLGSYYDFIDRLWLRDRSSVRAEQKKGYPYPKVQKPKGKGPGKGKKLPNRHTGIVQKLTAHILDGRAIPCNWEKLMQEILCELGVETSMRAGLISADALTVSGDGSSLHCHASSLGTKNCNCRANGIYDCKCPRKYSDVDATYGWDSDLGQWYFGYTLYTICTYDLKSKSDLPLYLRLSSAARHDSVNGLMALSEFSSLCPQYPITNLCLDSAHDALPYYQLCEKWNIRPFIDLNMKRGRPKGVLKQTTFSARGIPQCKAGIEMIPRGQDRVRMRQKWRCPLACGKVSSCEFQDQCSPSPYGRTFYTKRLDDLRLFPSVQRGSKAFQKIYSQRTACERVNKRILNDYCLHSTFTRSKRRLSFFALIAALNIHLDAQVKVYAVHG